MIQNVFNRETFINVSVKDGAVKDGADFVGQIGVEVFIEMVVKYVFNMSMIIQKEENADIITVIFSNP